MEIEDGTEITVWNAFLKAGAAIESLKKWSLRGCTIDMNSLSRLLSANIREIALDFSPPTILPFDEFIISLENCVLLESLFLSVVFHVDSFPSTTSQIQLPSLRKLFLGNMSSISAERFSKTVRLPALCDIILALSWHVDEEDPHRSDGDYSNFLEQLTSPGMLDPLSISRICLISLGLVLPAIPDPSAEPVFFHAFTGLSYIYLDFRRLQITFWRWFLQSLARGDLMQIDTVALRGVEPPFIQDLVLAHPTPRNLQLQIFRDKFYEFKSDSQLTWVRKKVKSLVYVEGDSRGYEYWYEPNSEI